MKVFEVRLKGASKPIRFIRYVDYCRFVDMLHDLQDICVSIRPLKR